MDPRKSMLLPMERRGTGSKGQKIHLLTNHFGVTFTKPTNQSFFHYSVALTNENGSPVEGNGIGRKILEQVQETYRSHLGSKYFAYDGESALFTVGPLPSNKLDFIVVLDDMSFSRNAVTNDADRKRLRRPNQLKKYNVTISYAARISMQAIVSSLQGRETYRFQEAIRVLDSILRQNSARQGCLLVRQSFFHNDVKYFANIGQGIDSCRGFHSSFRTTQGGLSLNIDTSSTMIIHPGPVLDFLIANQNVRNSFSIDWKKAKSTLKNLRVKAFPSNKEYRITGLSALPCKDQTFILKKKKDNREVEITIFDYFSKTHGIKPYDSADFPCINVGKLKHPNYIPIELCELVSLQHYTKALTSYQRTNLLNEARQTPRQKMDFLTRALKMSNYNANPMLRECGIRLGSDFTQVEGRVLPTPKLKAGNGVDIDPRNGRWKFNNKKLFEPARITHWAVVNFSVNCDMRKIVNDLIKVGKSKGINIDYPYDAFEENPRFKFAPGSVRVEEMFKYIQPRLPGKPRFLLCFLSERKTSDVYGPWKKKTLIESGVVNQCIVPPPSVNDQYLTNVLLKINAKLGGLNTVLDIEWSRGIPLVMRVPTIIIGMDVSHGASGQSDKPSVAVVVSSRGWPLISRYRACVRTQSHQVQMINNLFNRVSDKDDNGIMREILDDFKSSSNMKPNHIIIFRDGVSETQFNQVLNIELDQIMQACKFYDESWDPKFTVIVAQKTNHTKLFQTRSPAYNVPPGTIVDSKICHSHNNDFYLCAQAGTIGTTRPIHYHVLYDEIGFSTDDLQELVHSLSYVGQRSTSAISQVAPICYAHLAATQMGSVMKYADMSEMSVPPMPKLDKTVANSMFFC